MTFEIIKLVLTIITVMFTAVQIVFLISEIKSNKKWNAQDAAFKYCIRYSDVIKNMDEFDLRDVSKNDIIKLFDENTKKGKNNRKQITYILQYFERLSIGILCDYFDEEVVRRTLDYVFVNTYNKLEPYILLRRKETNKNIFSHYERVAKIWAEKPMKYPYRTTPSNRKKKQAR